MDFTLVATGTTFPLVFTISQAFARRERATSLVANLKASVVALYWMHRDWSQTENYPSSLGNDQLQWARKARSVLTDLCMHVERFLTTPDMFESMAERRLAAKRQDALLELFVHNTSLDEHRVGERYAHRVHRLERQDPGRYHLLAAYKCLSLLSVMNEQLTLKAGYTRGGEGGLSRTNQYLRYIVSNLEELRMIRDYRTPYMMRNACGLLLHLFAIILAPYFAHFCDSWIALGNEEKTCPAGYAASIVYVIIVMLLYHIQLDSEQPFDGTGLDDVFLPLHEEISEVTGGRQLSARNSEDLDASPAVGSSPRESYGWNASHVVGANLHSSYSDRELSSGGAGGSHGFGMGVGAGVHGLGHGLHGVGMGHSSHGHLSAKDLQSNKPLRPIKSNSELSMDDADEEVEVLIGRTSGEGHATRRTPGSPTASGRDE